MAIKRAKESFSFWDSKGVPRDVPAGTLIDTDKSPEVLKGREKLFEDVELYVDRTNDTSVKKVESATAEPGEKRSITTPVRTFRSPTEKKE